MRESLTDGGRVMALIRIHSAVSGIDGICQYLHVPRVNMSYVKVRDVFFRFGVY